MHPQLGNPGVDPLPLLCDEALHGGGPRTGRRRHLDATAEGAPGDIAWAHLGGGGAAVATGRAGRPFHARERHHVTLLGRVFSALRR